MGPACETVLVPHLPQPLLSTAWRYKNEPTKIHYRAYWPDGKSRHLLTREGEALYRLLDEHLIAIGYAAPASAAEDPDASPVDQDA